MGNELYRWIKSASVFFKKDSTFQFLKHVYVCIYVEDLFTQVSSDVYGEYKRLLDPGVV